MKNKLFAALLAALLLFGCSCGARRAEPYEKEHEHVYGFWYEAEDGTQVRYCKICHQAQTENAGE